MAGAKARAVVAVEVFVEQDQIAPVRVRLELLRTAVHRPPALFVLEEDIAAPARDLLSYFVEVHLPPRTGGTLDGEVVAVIGVVLQERANDQAVDGHPDRPAPV